MSGFKHEPWRKRLKRTGAIAGLVLLALLIFVSFQNCSGGFAVQSFSVGSQSLQSEATACSFNGAMLDSGKSVKAYKAATAPSLAACVSEDRACASGVLSGSFAFDSCVVAKPQAKKVSQGMGRACALVDGAIKCWGLNSSGYGGVIFRTDVNYFGSWNQNGAQIPLAGEKIVASGVTEISNRNYRNECHLVNGSVICSGQTTKDGIVYQFNTVVLAESGATVMNSSNNYACAVVNQRLKCWNLDVELIRTTPQVPSPVEVDLPASQISEIALDVHGLRGCAMSAGGKVDCWDFGYQVTSVSAPRTYLQGGAAKISLDASNSACAIVSGDLYCWTFGSGFALADGTRDMSTTPKLVLKDLSDISLYANGSITGGCAVMKDSSVKVWGGQNALPIRTVMASGAKAVACMFSDNEMMSVIMNDGRVLSSFYDRFVNKNNEFMEIDLSK